MSMIMKMHTQPGSLVTLKVTVASRLWRVTDGFDPYAAGRGAARRRAAPLCPAPSGAAGRRQNAAVFQSLPGNAAGGRR